MAKESDEILEEDILDPEEDDSYEEDDISSEYTNLDPDAYLEANSLRIMYQTNNFLLPQLVSMINNKKILDLSPEYQRRRRWTRVQKSRLIESLILNVPIPSIYFYEKKAAKYEVMDGQQRLSAINEFLKGKFALNGLKYLPRLNGKNYGDISSRVKRVIDRASITTVILLLENPRDIQLENNISDSDIRRLIFEKLNTGSSELNPQEIRQALYPTYLNKAILELSRYEKFTESFDLPTYTTDDPDTCKFREKREANDMYKKMKDCEYVLRFFALKETKEIKGSMKKMLDKTLESGVNVAKLKKDMDAFKSNIEFLYELFDGKPFRYKDRSRGQSKPSVNLYDSLMVAINELWSEREKILSDKDGVHKRLQKCVDDKVERLYLTGKYDSVKAIHHRIALAKYILSGKKYKE